MNPEQDLNVPVSVYILDKEYRIVCQAGEQDVLRASAQYLDRRMREIRQSGRIIGIDRIAVMAALNITHELLDERNTQKRTEQALSQQIQSLQARVEQALGVGGDA